jgi:hypothetical protein
MSFNTVASFKFAAQDLNQPGSFTRGQVGNV